MANYIDKDALEEKIDKRITDAPINYIGDQRVWAYNDVKDILNTLDVKVEGLEKEINKYISNNFFGSQTIGFYANRTNEEPNDQDIALCAKHFFELGLKVTRKGEKYVK